MGLFRFLIEAQDSSILIHRDDSEAVGVGQRGFNRADDRIRLLLDQQVVHVGIVHLVDVITGQDQQKFGHIIVEQEEILIHRVGGALDTNLR